jgi:uncharacterized membrane protein YdcZ (DUF606 family)
VSVDTVLLVLWSAVSAALGAFGLHIAARERKSGSSWWAWLLPGVFGALLIFLSVLRLVVAAVYRGGM